MNRNIRKREPTVHGDSVGCTKGDTLVIDSVVWSGSGRQGHPASTLSHPYTENAACRASSVIN